MNVNHFSSPQILSGNVDLPVEEVGQDSYGTVTLDTLASRSRRWFLAESLRIQAVQTSTTAGPFTADLPPIFSVKLSAYRSALTRDYTNIDLLGPSTFLMGGFGGNQNVASAGQAISNARRVHWVFSKPFLIPPGDAFNAQFKYTSPSGGVPAFSRTFNLSVSLAGRMVGKDEAYRLHAGKNPLPYVTSFEPLNTLGYTPAENYVAISNNLELANPFTRPYFVQRMIGASPNFNAYAYNVGPFPVDIEVSDTRTVVAERQNFRNLFSMQTSAFTCKRILQPTEYYKVKLTGLPITPSFSIPTNIVGVSIVGHREEEMP